MSNDPQGEDIWLTAIELAEQRIGALEAELERGEKGALRLRRPKG